MHWWIFNLSVGGVVLYMDKFFIYYVIDLHCATSEINWSKLQKWRREEPPLHHCHTITPFVLIRMYTWNNTKYTPPLLVPSIRRAHANSNFMLTWVGTKKPWGKWERNKNLVYASISYTPPIVHGRVGSRVFLACRRLVVVQILVSVLHTGLGRPRIMAFIYHLDLVLFLFAHFRMGFHNLFLHWHFQLSFWSTTAEAHTILQMVGVVHRV